MHACMYVCMYVHADRSAAGEKDIGVSFLFLGRGKGSTCFYGAGRGYL